MTKQETLPKRVGVQNLTSPKYLVINIKIFIFTYKVVITSILDYKLHLNYFKVQNHEHLNDCFFECDLFINSLECNCISYV